MGIWIPGAGRLVRPLKVEEILHPSPHLGSLLATGDGGDLPNLKQS